jgi:DNA polymerase III alpha subunit (gram-positive type)
MSYICFDTETSGLDPLCNLLTACFIVLDENLNEIDILNLQIKHDHYYVSTKALEVNHINLIEHNNHKDSVTLKQASELLYNFLAKNKRGYPLIPIGHNLQFDILFVKKMLSNTDYNKFISWNQIDTIVLAQFLKLSNKISKYQSISLVNLGQLYNIKIPGNAHTAEYDTKMTIEVLKRMKCDNTIDQQPNKKLKK